MSIFDTLNAINVNEHTEKKNGLTYLSWAWAWGILKKHYPMSYYTIYEQNGLNYFSDGRTGYVKTGVTVVDGDTSLEHIEYLPIMDYKNQSIPAERITSFDVNKAIQRSLTKAVARHGLGLYIYSGEDLPEVSAEAVAAEQEAYAAARQAVTDALDAYCKSHEGVNRRDVQKEVISRMGVPAKDAVSNTANCKRFMQILEGMNG